jgi:type I restriction enzyme R subunit
VRQDSRHRDLALPAAAAGRERSSHFSRFEKARFGNSEQGAALKSDDTPIIAENIVNRIDESSSAVFRFEGWHSTIRGDQ